MTRLMAAQLSITTKQSSFLYFSSHRSSRKSSIGSKLKPINSSSWPVLSSLYCGPSGWNAFTSNMSCLAYTCWLTVLRSYEMEESPGKKAVKRTDNVFILVNNVSERRLNHDYSFSSSSSFSYSSYSGSTSSSGISSLCP